MSEVVYGNAALYKLAFAYRDFEAEVTFLNKVYSKVTGHVGVPESVLEVAAGNAQHTLDFIRRGTAAVGAVDLSHAMIESMREAFSRLDVAVELIEAQMSSFITKRRYALAICMLDSLSHLIEQGDLVAHFRSIARALQVDGTYIVELSWPKTARQEKRTCDRWTAEDDSIRLDVTWGEDTTDFDPTRRVSHIPVRFEAYPKAGGAPLILSDSYLGREWTLAEMEVAANEGGGFRLLYAFSDFEISKRYTNSSKDGWRMILAFARGV